MKSKNQIPLEISSSNQSKRFQLASRTTYLPAIFPLDWFATASETPLKWHYPIGLLYDIYHKAFEPNNTPLFLIKSNPLSTLPTNKLFSLESSQNSPFTVVQEYFYSALKETGSVKKISSLSYDSQFSLWTSLLENDQAKFLETYPEIKDLRFIPFRLYFLDKTAGIDSNSFISVFQEPVPPINPLTGKEYTVGEVVGLGGRGLDKKVLVQGIFVNMDLSLKVAYELLGYPDGFLHMVVY